MKKSKPTITDTAKKAVLQRARKVKKELSSRTGEAKTQARRQAVKTAQNVVRLQQKTFDSVFKLVGQLQDHSQKVIKDAVGKAEWLPKEGKAVVEEWIKMLHGSRVKFQDTVDKSFGLVTQFLNRVEREEAPKPAAPKKATRRRRRRRKGLGSGV